MVARHFRPTDDWKDKIKNSCECFTGGNNRFCLSDSLKDKECLQCEFYEFKQMLYSKRKPSSLKFALYLFKLNRFYRKEILAAIQELFPNLDAANIFRNVHNQIINDPKYYYFITKMGIIKVYEKDKI